MTAPATLAAGRSDAPHDDVELAVRLRIAVARLTRVLRQHSYGGLTLTQLSALVTVERHGRVRLGDLAAQEGVTPPTLTRVVASLERDGLLRRDSDPDDRRVAWVSITDDGARTLERLRGERTLVLSARLATLDAEARDAVSAAVPALEALAQDL